MAVRKEYRDLTVGNIYRNGKSVPMLRVGGLWLEELGFKTGDFVKIKCENGQLIISLNEEKAQEKAAEKVFMDEEMKKLRKRYQREAGQYQRYHEIRRSFRSREPADRDFQKRKKHGLRRCAEFPERNRTWHRCAAVCEKE